jgi:hypothetical protein
MLLIVSVFMFRHQTTGQIYYTEVANKSFNNWTKFKYLDKTVNNENRIHKEIKSR